MDGCIFPDGTTKNNFEASMLNVDFSLATHIKNSYNCNIVTNASSTLRLKYLDSSDNLTVVNATA
jgi:hypothetical protein